MRKLIGLMLTVVLVLGSFGGFGQEASATGQKTLVPDAKATIQLEKTPEKEPVDDRKLIIEGTYKELPLLDDVMHVAYLPIRMENSKGEAEDIIQDDITFTSSNEEIFTVEEHMLSGKKIGTADIIIVFQGKETRIQIKVTNDVVNLKFEDERAQDFYAFYARYYNVTEKAFDYMDIVTSYDEKAGVLKVHGIDWSKPGPYYVDFMVDNALYAVEITKTDKNKTKKISAELAEVTLDTGDYAISNVNPLFIKQGVVALDTGFINASFHYAVTPGDYEFNVSAVHDTDYYSVRVPKVNVQAGEQVVQVSFDTAVPVKVTPNLKGESVFDSMFVCGALCEDVSSTFSTLHVTKGLDFLAMPVIENKDLYYQFNYEYENVNNAREIKLDDRIKSTLKFSNQVYKGGSDLVLEDVLTIKNSADANLVGLHDEAYNFYGGKLIFENVEDASETYTYELDYFPFDTIQLPNTTGKFNVTFTFGEITPQKMIEYVDLEDDWYYYADPIPIVATDYMWTVRFNAPVKDETVTPESVFVADNEGYIVKDAQVYVEGDTIYVYAPEDGYSEGELYYVCVRNTVENIAGKSMKYNIKMAFETSNTEK